MRIVTIKLKNIFLTLLFLSFALPTLAIEVIQTQETSERIKQNTRLYNKSQLKEVEREGIEIKNPIDLMKKETKAQPPKEPSRVSLDCDVMEYKNDTNEVEAKGNVVINSYPDRIKLTADRGVFDRTANIIKLFDNVRMYKAGGVLKGDYMVVDLNTENVLLNEPIGEFTTFKLTAREGHAYANKIEAINGDIEIARKLEIRLQSSGFGSTYEHDFIMGSESDKNFELKKRRSEPFDIKTREIIIKANKDHDDITFKDADIYFKKFKLATASNVQIYTDKEQNYMETNIPEIGSLPDFGTFFGPAYVFKTPGNSTFKVAPIVVSGDGGIGFGGIVRHRSKRNWAEAAWGSNNQNLIVRGHYDFNDKFRVDYSRHGYTYEGIWGENRPGYLAQLTYEDTWHNNDLNADYWQMISGGYVSDYFKDNQEDHSGTMRLKWQGRLSKDFVTYEGKEQDSYLRIGASAEAAASVYGTGDTFALARVGPYIHSRLKGWGSKIYFLAGGVHGKSPYLFDEYRYGKFTISFDETIKLNKYFALGWRGSLTPMKDNYDKKFLTENKFYALVGPEDVKVAISYDTVREYAGFDVIFLLGMENRKIKYEKLTVDNPSNVGQKQKMFEEWNLRKIKVPEAI